MFVLKVTTFFLVAIVVGAEKKIELQDIEDDNLRSEIRSETEKEQDKVNNLQSSGLGSGPSVNSLDFLKSGLLRYFHNSGLGPQRYVQQYAVHEPSENSASGRVTYGPPSPQQTMVGYLSNFPMQIYLVPQYFGEKPQHTPHSHTAKVSHLKQSHKSGGARQAEDHTDREVVREQNNYLEIPSFMQASGKSYVQSYTPTQAITYVTYPTLPTVPAPQVTVAPVVAYHSVPVIQYNPGLVSIPSPSKTYYQNPDYSDTNAVDDALEREPDPKQYNSQTEAQYHNPNLQDYPRHYNSRAPISIIRNEHGLPPIPELPHPSPEILAAPPSHLAHLAKTLPKFRPQNRPYQGHNVPNVFTPRPKDRYVTPPRRHPTSLIDSYIPSSIQAEYLKRGLVRNPGDVYDAISSGRLPQLLPQHFERGFIPNQMYHTGGGGPAYTHIKRTVKPKS